MSNKYSKYQKEWFSKHPEYKQKYLERVNDKRMKTREEVAGRPKPEICEICGGGGRIYFDHDHATGRFRGWICQGCNTALGHVRDSKETLYKLIQYLDKDKGVALTPQQALLLHLKLPK